MSSIIIEGNIPLTGNVTLSGAKNSVLKLISASMFSNDDIIIDNVPRIENVLMELEIVAYLGAKVEWIGSNKLLINGSGLRSFEIPYEVGSKYKTTNLLTAPLIYRFGQAKIPKISDTTGLRKVNRLIDTWKQLGMEVTEDDKYLKIRADSTVKGANINFRISTHMGTDNAILSSIFASGETIISNAGEESEIDDLISFCNLIGADVTRVEPRRIRVVGKNVFKGGNYKIQNDKNEAVAFAIAALLTGGNINIRGVEKSWLIAFTNVLTKINAKFEFIKDELRIWHSAEPLLPATVTSTPAPGFMTEWLPLITLLFTKLEGESLVHDTIYTDKLAFAKDLNMMGAKIEICKPSQVGLIPIISDDSYDFERLGEPSTVAKINGPSKLRGTKLNIKDLRAGPTLILAALAAEGKSEISNYEVIEYGYEHFFQKLLNLGAKIAQI